MNAINTNYNNRHNNNTITTSSIPTIPSTMGSFIITYNNLFLSKNRFITSFFFLYILQPKFYFILIFCLFNFQYKTKATIILCHHSLQLLFKIPFMLLLEMVLVQLSPQHQTNHILVRLKRLI